MIGCDAHFIREVDDIVAFMAENTESGDVVLVMSSGGFGDIHGLEIAKIAKNKRWSRKSWGIS